MNRRPYYSSTLWGLGVCLLAGSAWATDLDKVDNWDVDGAHGTLQVHGALTESACRLAMRSAWQTVDLGTMGTGLLSRIGQQGKPVAFQLTLEDCLSGESRNYDKLGDILWSPDMPAMKIRFLAPADNWAPELVKVTGAQGFGLSLSDAKRHPIALGEFSQPQLMSPGRNELTYYITPVRTLSGLSAGAYQAQIQFQLSYD